MVVFTKGCTKSYHHVAINRPATTKMPWTSFLQLKPRQLSTSRHMHDVPEDSHARHSPSPLTLTISLHLQLWPGWPRSSCRGRPSRTLPLPPTAVATRPPAQTWPDRTSWHAALTIQSLATTSLPAARCPLPGSPTAAGAASHALITSVHGRQHAAQGLTMRCSWHLPPRAAPGTLLSAPAKTLQ